MAVHRVVTVRKDNAPTPTAGRPAIIHVAARARTVQLDT
jgi:hypothetical protein